MSRVDNELGAHMPRKARTGTCVYCGTNGPVTSDHVPPKCLFPPGARINLMTVAACPPCHDSFKLDDEYFRLVLSIRRDLPSSPESSFLQERATRSLRSPQAAGLLASIRSSTSHREARTKAGIYLGETPVLKVDAPRIIRTAERIVRGMFAKVFGIVLPRSHEAAAVLLDLQRNDSALLHPDVQETLAYLGRHGHHKQFGKVLDFWCARVEDDEFSSMWAIRIHEVFDFLGYTTPRGS